MDRMYRLTRHVYDLSRKYYLLGRDRLIADLAPPPGGAVLEMGCGTARNLIAAARRHPAARFHGFDISEEMLKTARANVARAGLSERITLAQGDATAFDAATIFGVGGYERIYFSYTLSMVPAWTAAIDEAVRLLGPGGRLHVVDFGAGRGLPGPLRRLLWAWLRLFHVTPRLDLARELARAARAHGRTLESLELHRGYAQYHVLG
ncbi:class I SAM-dependent methyltransferase [Siculibacillus lacustris]|uniref:Class I SAM-dependent methyltransferase n=2 Tax=Siculibacillus lacustris TaxID=1549641 RepID=A0A4Q9VPC5_9HYPH|nr:class I SAM-dependent methyltransferase [Siculibacillus lacustris]